MALSSDTQILSDYSVPVATDQLPLTKPDFVRSQAIRAAETLLATHGLSVTMDLVAEASGISRRSLFRHFESRDALVAAALDARILSYEVELNSVTAAGGELSEWLATIIEHTHRSHIAAGLGMWELASAADGDLPAEFREVNARRRAMRLRATKQLAAQAWQAGGGNGSTPEVVVEAIAMAASSFATYALVVDLDQSVEVASKLGAAVVTAVIEANL